jgi:hypothetical protein
MANLSSVVIASAGAAIGGVVLVILAIALYMLPTIVGSVRKVVNIGSVFAINLFLGWSLVGWVVALAMALRTNPPHAYPQMWQQEPAPASGVPGVPPHPMSVSPAAPPGWYPDAQGVTRWWDGSQWTSTVQPPPRSTTP